MAKVFSVKVLIPTSIIPQFEIVILNDTEGANDITAQAVLNAKYGAGTLEVAGEITVPGGGIRPQNPGGRI